MLCSVNKDKRERQRERERKRERARDRRREKHRAKIENCVMCMNVERKVYNSCFLNITTIL